MELYHGSNVTVEHPQILVSGFYKDFGYGFYCTSLEKQARKWALTKKGNSIVSVFQYQPCTIGSVPLCIWAWFRLSTVSQSTNTFERLFCGCAPPVFGKDS